MQKKAKNNAEPVVTVAQRIRMNRRALIKDAIILIIVVGVILLFFRIFKFPKVNGDSMSPLYHNNERLVAIATNDVDVGDVVIAWDNVLDSEGAYIVKRVVGIGGDHIEIKDGMLYRNGTPVYEGYIKEKIWGMQDSVDVTVPENDVFLLGDNRNHSTDSRKIGTVPVDNIKMKVLGTLDFMNSDKS